MDREQVFEVIKQNILAVLPELASRSITIEDSLRELGANSVDRAEILIRSIAALQINSPLVDFAQASNIEELVSRFQEKLQAQKK